MFSYRKGIFLFRKMCVPISLLQNFLSTQENRRMQSLGARPSPLAYEQMANADTFFQMDASGRI